MPHLRPIDDALLPAHCFLTKDDTCSYLLDYCPSRFDTVKRIIMDFKKTPEKDPRPEYIFKAMATWKIAALLAEAIPPFYQSDEILVPIPPSKTRDHPLHDDRMVRLLRLFRKCHPPADVREMILTSVSVAPSHDATVKPGPEKILHNLRLDSSFCEKKKDKIVLVDDLITTGAHFKACKKLLQGVFPDAQISGLFIARRVLPPAP